MIELSNIGKKYKVYSTKGDRLKEWLSLGQRQYHREFWALKGIDLKIASGAVFGIVGMNGAGKSTLLKILTGTTIATEGDFSITGRMASLLELGTGFHPELTGRENVLINGRLLGLEDGEIHSKMAEIIAFCELKDFFDKPVRTYSSGMYVRLAFSLATSVDPDVLIIDEALSVGDAYFQQKCIKRLREFKSRGTTILFVSHDAAAIKMLCDQVALLDQGRLLKCGDPQEMIETYNALLAKKDGEGHEYLINRGELAAQAEGLSFGNLKAEIEKIELQDSTGEPVVAVVAGQKVRLHIQVAFRSPIDCPTIGILIQDKLGYDVFGTNTAELAINSGAFKPGQKIDCTFSFPMNLGVGDYTITAAIHSERTHVEECYQWMDRVLTFKVLQREDFKFLGVAFLKPHITIEPRQ